MDLGQKKLSKSEWASIEIMVSPEESRILSMMNDGYNNHHVCFNAHATSLLSILKIDYSPAMDRHLYEKYFKQTVSACDALFAKKGLVLDGRWKPNTDAAIVLKAGDRIRLENTGKTVLSLARDDVIEYKQLFFCEELIKAYVECDIKRTKERENEREKEERLYLYYLYTLLRMDKSTIAFRNRHVSLFVDSVLAAFCSTQMQTQTQMVQKVFEHAHHVIEKNENLLKYEDTALYSHQKELFALFKRCDDDAKLLVLYTSPTGSGKTVSPLGLSVRHRIIFICAARHVGLSLAKSAIFVNKKVAFAFGCESANDIRLHYFAAADYTRSRRSGAIAKVDNGNGSKVEIMICDIGSYLIAMYYMLSFNRESDLLLFWDEPTISLDVDSHALHPVIQKNWIDNKISKIVLSSATLPDENDIRDVIDDFRNRFEGCAIHSISSFDCKKTISLLDSTNRCILPHLLFSDYAHAQECVRHIEKNKTLLRYLDLREVVRFCRHVVREKLVADEFAIEAYFPTVADVTLMSMKMYYLFLVGAVGAAAWPAVHTHLTSTLCKNYSDDIVKKKTANSHTGILLTTEHAHTLTDGPSIYLTNDVTKIATFLYEQSHIPEAILASILDKIECNEGVRRKIEDLTKRLDDEVGQDDRKIAKEIYKPNVKSTMERLDVLRHEIKAVRISSVYIPNTLDHQDAWLRIRQPNSFACLTDEAAVLQVMRIDVPSKIKVLLLMGIGVFEKENESNRDYLQLIKQLANDQKLFLIVASSDYIYGTNYQFCHGFIAKDLVMSQEKIIQSFGRVGRGNIQQDYTIRIRNNDIATKLFLPDPEKIEATNMCRLFQTPDEA